MKKENRNRELELEVENAGDLAEMESAYEIPDEACCSAEFPQGCIFGD
jgi:hypothetical protein